MLTIITANLYSKNDTQKDTLRVMTYNIRNGIGMDMKANYDRTANAIIKWKPDVVAIQEVDSVTKRSNKLFIAEELGNRTGMQYTYASAINFDGGKYGIALLSKEAPLQTYKIPLPGREEARVLLVVEFEKYVFLTLHLSLTPEDQVLSFKAINAELEKTDKPIFIAGDFNAFPNDEAIKLLKKNFTIVSPLNVKTYPADKPTDPIDYIAISKSAANHCRVLDSFVPNESETSDHRPIVTDIEIK